MLKFKADLTDDYLMCIEDLKNEQMNELEIEMERLQADVDRCKGIVQRATKNILYTHFNDDQGLEVQSILTSPKSDNQDEIFDQAREQ